MTEPSGGRPSRMWAWLRWRPSGLRAWPSGQPAWPSGQQSWPSGQPVWPSAQRTPPPWAPDRPAGGLAPVGAVELVAIPVLLAAATFVSAQPWLRVFSVAAAPLFFVLAAVLPVAVATGCIRLARQPPSVSYTVSALAFMGLLLAVNGLHLTHIFHGFHAGPNEMLTETLPLAGNPGLLSGPLLLTWLCGAASSELVLRARRRAVGTPAIGLAIPIGCYVLAYAVAASRPGRDDVGGPVLFVALVLIAVARHSVRLATTTSAGVGSAIESDARPSNWRPGLVGAVAAAVVVSVLAAALPAVSHLSGRPASVGRRAPLASVTVLDPVDALAALRDENPGGKPVRQLTITTDRASTGYLAMAVLDRYDGALWSFDATFDPTGGRIPAASGQPPAVADQTDVRQSVTLEAPLVIPLLPALDRPVTITGVDAAADNATGMLVAARRLDAQDGYDVVSHTPAMTLVKVPRADGIGLPISRGASSEAALTAAAELALPADSSPAMATVLQYLSKLTGERPAPTVAFLQAVVNALQQVDRRIVSSQASRPPVTPTTSPARHRPSRTKRGPVPTTTTTIPSGSLVVAGTSLSEVITAVTIRNSATPEQFATLLAMVARYLGVPARLVTGFRVAPSSDGSPLRPGVYQVTNRQAWAWVEIPVAGLGWVVADPTPDTTTLAPPPTPQQAQATATTLPPPQANAVPSSEILGGHALAKPAHVKVPQHHPVPWWVVALIVLGGSIAILLLVGPGLAAVRRALRRRARRGPDPAHLAVGAWLELLDGLEQAGMAVSAGDAGREVAAEAGRHFGVDVAEPILDVAAVADQAVCSSHAPGPAAAERAWEAQRAVRRTVHRGLDRRQRARAVLTVGTAPRRPE